MARSSTEFEANERGLASLEHEVKIILQYNGRACVYFSKVNEPIYPEQGEYDFAILQML
jgi:hypothetical protein